MSDNTRKGYLAGFLAEAGFVYSNSIFSARTFPVYAVWVRVANAFT